MHGNMSRGRTTRRVAKIDFGIFSANQNPFVWSSIDLIGLSSWVDTSKNTSCSTRDNYRPNQSTRNATWLRSFHSKPFELGKWRDSDLLCPQVIQFSRRLGRKVRPIFFGSFSLTSSDKSDRRHAIWNLPRSRLAGWWSVPIGIEA